MIESYLKQENLKTPKQPVLFVGHGSPMNIVASNSYTQSLKTFGQTLKEKDTQAILAISAHWVTEGTKVQASVQPKTIYDFGGFPEELYKVKFQKPGVPEMAMSLQKHDPLFQPTEDWGLDHGTWSVLHHMLGGQNIPVVQMSMNQKSTFQEHQKIAEQLTYLRTKGVMILASGNLVHNLRQISWDENATPFDWALEFNEEVKNAILDRDDNWLATPSKNNSLTLFRQAHPTVEHYFPLAYALGASDSKEKITPLFEGMQNASISMASYIFGD